jgi:Flp pilus assembly protein TadG
MRRTIPRLPRLRRRIAAESRRPGQSIVELAIVVPVLLLLAVGVFEFGRALHAYVTVTHAARDGARVAMDPTKSNADVVQRAKDAANPLSVTPTVLSRTTGGRARVQVTYGFTTPVPLISEFWGGGTLTIKRVAESEGDAA